MAGNEQRKQAVRRWKLEKPQDGQVQSPGLGRFFDGGKGVRISAARSRTRLEEGETSIAFSLRARPFMHRLSAACGIDRCQPNTDMDNIMIPDRSHTSSWDEKTANPVPVGLC